MRKSSQVLMGAISLASVVTGVELGANASSTGNFVPHPTVTPTVDPTTQRPKPTTPPPAATVSHKSSPVHYRFGTVQLTVTKTGTKITNITMNQAGATNGRAASFPYLITLAKKAQSGSFDTSIMSGATYSTPGFIQELGDALAQF